jgi:hypothetical protein
VYQFDEATRKIYPQITSRIFPAIYFITAAIFPSVVCSCPWLAAPSPIMSVIPNETTEGQVEICGVSQVLEIRQRTTRIHGDFHWKVKAK